MPHEDKKNLAGEAGKEKKRFKAVTEEITFTPPISETPPVLRNSLVPVEEKPHEPPKTQETHQYHQERPQQHGVAQQAVSVPETNNLSYGLTEKPKKNIFLFFGVMLLVALVVMALAGGMYVYFNGVKNLPQTELTETPTETSAPQVVAQATPVPTATPKPDYSLYSVSVLNGSGAIGAATGVKDLIQKGGFKVGYTGNADNFGFSDTVIQVKNTVSADVVAALKSLLVPTYTIKIGTALDSQSRWDIIVTVGTK